MEKKENNHFSEESESSEEQKELFNKEKIPEAGIEKGAREESGVSDEWEKPYSPIVLRKGLFHRFFLFLIAFPGKLRSHIHDSLKGAKKKTYDEAFWAGISPQSYKSRLDVFFAVSLLIHLMIFFPLLSRTLEKKKIVNTPLKVKILEIPEVSKIMRKKAQKKSVKREKIAKKLPPQKVKVAKKELKKVEKPPPRKSVVKPKEQRTNEKYDKPRTLVSQALPLKEPPREQENPLELLKGRIDVSKKNVVAKKVPELLRKKEALKKPLAPESPSEMKLNVSQKKPKVLLSKTGKLEGKFKAAKTPFPITEKTKLKEDVSRPQKSAIVPEELKENELFQKPEKTAPLITQERPKRLESSRPVKPSGTEKAQGKTEEVQRLLSDHTLKTSELKQKTRTKDVIDKLEGREVLRAPEGPVAMAKAPVDLRKKVKHPLVKDKEAVYVSMDTDDPMFKDYIEKVKRKIIAVWGYPEDERPGLRGRVSLEFMIEIDGTVSRVSVTASSGYSSLDRGASNAVENAAPFPPVPPALLGDKRRLAINGNFKYN